MVIANFSQADGLAQAQDEGWWNSVLADEECFLAHQRTLADSPTTQREPPPPTSRIDWNLALKTYHQDQIISLPVNGYNHGGLLVEGEGLRGFVPYSHLVEMNCGSEPEREKFLSNYVNRSLRLKIIECAPEEGRIVFSERAARADAGRRPQLFTSLQPGQIVSGEVTNVTDFGGFIDLGGVEGLIHISELSWGRVVHPASILKVGQRVDVQILDILPERCRIALSLKRLQPNPWLNLNHRYAIGDIVPATVTSVVSFGIFARLEDGIEGLVHASEIDLPDKATVKATFCENQLIHVRVLHLDPAHQRLGLSLKLDAQA